MSKNRISVLAMLGAVLITGGAILAQQAKPGPRGGRPTDTGTFQTAVPAHEYDVILARPGKNAVTLSVLAYGDSEAFVAYGTKPGAPATQTPAQPLKKGIPAEILLKDLQPDTAYSYRFHWRAVGVGDFAPAAESTFHTARPAGTTFTFTITADSHLDERSNPALYRQTLANIRADRPDFHIDLGDTFMIDKHPTRDSAAQQYLAQRYYLGLLATPLFLVLGNHDGESVRDYDGTPDSLAVWSNTLRKRYFANPVPDTFFSGNKTPDKFAGPLQNYYAWTWGDAQFIVLDPYWHSARPRGRDDNWAWSLGQEQYRWLADTLAQSKAKYKCVFIHHLVGGLDSQGRGGAEAAPFYEWGGKNADGTPGFKAHRPDFDAPIHDLLVRHKVTAVFHGHDHFYAHQELDGVIYQMVPQPGTPGPDRPRTAEEYGYKNGTLVGGAGHLRVTVAPQKVQAEYIRSAVSTSGTAQRPNGEVARHWVILAQTPSFPPR